MKNAKLPDGYMLVENESGEQILAGPGLNLFSVNLAGADLSGIDLRGADLRGAKLENVKLPDGYMLVENESGEQILAGPCLFLSDTDFTGADLRGLDLKGAKLKGAIFTRADLRGADLSDTYLGRDVDFTNADLSGAKLPDGYKYVQLNDGRKVLLGPSRNRITESDLSACDLSDVNFRSGYFGGVQFKSANLRGAQLEHVVFDGCDLQGADLARCNLQFSKIGLKQRESVYGIVNMDGADLSGANLTGAKLKNVKLTRAIVDDETEIKLPDGYFVKECEDGLQRIFETKEF